jgi:ureidoglycolate hydrolase
MNVRSEELTERSIAGIGHLLTPADGPAPRGGEEFTCVPVRNDLELEGTICALRLECAARSMRVAKMERHLRTPEMLTAVSGDAVVCMAPPQDGKDGHFTGVKALLVHIGQSFILDRGAWHWIPFPIGRDSVRFQVVFRDATGKDDLEILDVAEVVEVEF